MSKALNNKVKLNEAVSVADYGALGGSNDDTAAIQAAINANPGKVILGLNRTSVVNGTITVSSNNTILQGFRLVQNTPNVDTIVFKPTTAGTTSAYLNSVGIVDSRISHSSLAYTTATSGAAVRFLQCNAYRLFNVTVNDAFEGITVQGGQFGSLKTFSVFAAGGAYSGDGTALVHFREAPYGAGLYQPCYTVEVEDFRLTSTLLRDTCIRVSNCDGLTVSNGYVANGKLSLLMLKAERDGGYISSPSFNNVYFDCVGAGKTPTGVSIPDDGFANTFVYHLVLGSGCTIGNGDGVGVLSRKANLSDFSIDGILILNMLSWAVDIQGGASTNIRIQNSRLGNNGDGTSGAVLVTGCQSAQISGNTFSSTENLVLKFDGTIGSASVVGNTNNSNVSDLVKSTATFTNGLALGANSSVYTGATSNSWKTQSIIASATLDFPSTAVGAASTLTTTVNGAVVGDPVTVTLNGSTNIVNTGTAFFLFSGGITAANTVSVRAYNLSGATSDPVSFIFNILVHKV